jgi:hypothetical protein
MLSAFAGVERVGAAVAARVPSIATHSRPVALDQITERRDRTT